MSRTAASHGGRESQLWLWWWHSLTLDVNHPHLVQVRMCAEIVKLTCCTSHALSHGCEGSTMQTDCRTGQWTALFHLKVRQPPNGKVKLFCLALYPQSQLLQPHLRPNYYSPAADQGLEERGTQKHSRLGKQAYSVFLTTRISKTKRGSGTLRRSSYEDPH